MAAGKHLEQYMELNTAVGFPRSFLRNITNDSIVWRSSSSPNALDHIFRASGSSLLKFHHISDNSRRNLGVDQ